MNFLKNFGAAAGGSSNMSSKPLGSKNNYFSSLKLQDDSPQKPKGKEMGKEKRQGPPKDFVPNKYALVFNPPCISTLRGHAVLEYKDPSTDKLYHHKMRLKKLKKSSATKDALEYLKKRHQQYFSAKVIDEQQIEKLIEKLKKGLEDENEKMEDVQEEDDFDFDYDDDFDDL